MSDMDKEKYPSITRKGFILVNYLYPDDEGFYKNTWTVETDGRTPFFSERVPGTSSYTNFSVAKEKFYEYVDNFFSVPVDDNGTPISVGWKPSFEGEEPPH